MRRRPPRSTLTATLFPYTTLFRSLGIGDFPLFTAKLHTDLNYMRCAQLLRDCQDCIFPAFASHNAMTLAFVSELFAGADYELQRLHGMGEGAHDALDRKSTRLNSSH